MLTVKHLLAALAATLLFIVTLIFKPIWVLHALGLLLLLASVSIFYHPLPFLTVSKASSHVPPYVPTPKKSSEDQEQEQLQQALDLKYGTDLVERNIQASFDLLTTLSNNKNPSACYELAHCYHWGLGTNSNPLKAIHWYHAYTRLSSASAPLREQPAAKKEIAAIVLELQKTLAFRKQEPKIAVNALCQLGLYFRWYASATTQERTHCFENKIFEYLSAARNTEHFNKKHCLYYFDTLYELGCCYIRGNGTDIDYAKAKEIYQCLYKEHHRHNAFYPLVVSLLHLKEGITQLSQDFIKGYQENIPELTSAYEDACGFYLCSPIPAVEKAKKSHLSTHSCYDDLLEPHIESTGIFKHAQPLPASHLDFYNTPIKKATSPRSPLPGTANTISHSPLTPISMRDTSIAATAPYSKG